MTNEKVKWLLLEKEGKQELYSKKFNFFFLLGVHIPLVPVLDTILNKLYERLLFYVLIYGILMAGSSISSDIIILTLGAVAFHFTFMGWHLFTRKSAILERRKKEGWVILAETGVRKKRDAEVQFAAEGLLNKQLTEK